MKMKKYVLWSFAMILVLMFGFRTVYAAEHTENEPNSAWVVASLYKDGSILFDGATSATMTAKVPYFDLADYDMEEYRLLDEEGEVIEKPTLLHAIIYLIEKYSLQGDVEKLGTGYYKGEVFDTEKNGSMFYYKEDSTKGEVTQSGGTMLLLNHNVKPTSLWGFSEDEIRIYLNQTWRKWKIHEALLEDVNTIEFMLLSEENTREIVYPHFKKNAYQIKVGDSIESPVDYYDIDGSGYQFGGYTKIYMASHMEKMESLNGTIEGGSEKGTLKVGPFQYPGIYTAKVILYPFYYKQIIEVRDTVEKVDLSAMNEKYTLTKQQLSPYESEIQVVPGEFYDFSEKVSVELGEETGKITSIINNEDGSLTVTVSYPKSDMSLDDKEDITPPVEDILPDTPSSADNTVKKEEQSTDNTIDKGATTIKPSVPEKPKKVKKGDAFTISGAVYKVTKASSKNGTVEYVKRKKSTKTVTIPEVVKIKGVNYKVTSIASKAFYNNRKMTKVTIGKNVSKIGKRAFYGCKKLKSIIIKTTKLKKSNVGSKAFSGIYKKAVVKVPKNKIKTYRVILKSHGAKYTITVKK